MQTSLTFMNNEELDRLNQLKAMHMLMCLSKENEIYNEWTEAFKDMPNEFDYEAVARNKEQFLKCYSKFCELVARNDYLDRCKVISSEIAGQKL